MQTRRYSEAIVYAKKAMAIFPNDPLPYAQIAYAMAKKKDPEASEWAKKAIAKDPSNYKWWGALADTFNMQGKWEEGLEPMRKAISLAPQNPKLLSAFGTGLVFVKKYKEAVDVLQKAVQLDPQDARSHLVLGNALLKTRDKADADRHIRKALELQPDNPIMQDSFGWYMLRRGQRADANEAFYEALRLDPQLITSKIALRHPAGSKNRFADVILRNSTYFALIPHRRLVNGIDGALLLVLVEIILLGPVVDIWLRFVEFAVVVLLVYILIAPLLVRAIARRRTIRFL